MSIPHNPVILDPFRKGAVFIQSNLTFRQLRRWFGRVALTLLVTLLATQLLSYGSVVAWQTLVGPLSYTMLMVLNDITIYLPCLVLIPLMLRRIPRADPIPDAALSGQERFLALVFSLGSDGTDGPTDAAGGIVDGATFGVLQQLGISIPSVLAENDAYHALKHVDGLIVTGPTGTNVNDAAVILIQGQESI